MINNLVNENRISVEVGKNELFYTFANEGDYWETARKIINEQKDDGLLPCFRILYNGSTRLVYFVRNCRPLKSSMGFDRRVVLNVIEQILSIIQLVGRNDFLNLRNLVFDSDKIFIDSESKSVYMIYVPVTQQEIDVDDFGTEIRNAILGIAESFSVFKATELERLKYHILSNNLGIEELRHYISNFTFENPTEGTIPMRHIDRYSGTQRIERCIVLSSLDNNNKCDLIVNGPEYIIGKKAGMANGVVSFNPAISRVHCKVVCEESDYYVIDMNSSNGTYINGNRLEPGKMYQVHKSDVIRLANSDFEVQEVEV